MAIKINNLDLNRMTQSLESISNNLTIDTKIKGLQAVGKEAIRLIRDRTRRGIDREGKRIPALTRNYRQAKLNMIRGKWRFPRGPRDSQFRAKSVPNHGRLTGHFFGKMGWVISQGKLILVLKDNLAKNKAKWLESTKGKARNGRSYSKRSRKIWGLADPNTNQGRKEREALRKAFFEAI